MDANRNGRFDQSPVFYESMDKEKMARLPST